MALILSGTDGVQDNSGAIVRDTAKTATGTNVDFTGIPSWVKRVTVLMNDVSLTGTATVMVRLGTASGIEASAIYFSMGGAITTAIPGVASAFNYTTGFGLVSAAAGNLFAGQIIITNLTGNTWVMTGTGSGSTSNVLYFMGRVTLTGALTQLRCTNNGSDTFDSGTINIIYE